MVRLTDRPDMTLDVYRGRKTTIQPTVFDTSNICSAVFTLAINRLHSFKRQPFWFHSLNSMVPVKGIDLFY